MDAAIAIDKKLGSGFLSEMSAEPFHGGGVTLARVLSRDALSFDWIAKTLHYESEIAPQYTPSSNSCIFPWWKHQQYLAKILGCSLAFRMANHPFIRKKFAKAVSSRLRKEIPEIYRSRILVCPQADISLLVTKFLQRHGNLDYVTWMMDDHLVRWRDGDWVYPTGFEPILREHLQNARRVFVISNAMQKFYHERFHVTSTVLHSPAEFQRIVTPKPSGVRNKLVYFGSLGPWQNDAIELLAPAIAAGDASLDIFTSQPNFIPRQLTNAGVKVRKPVPSSVVQSKIAEYDAVVLPVSFLDEKRNMSFFNIATKFSECLGSGIPTLIIGPPYSAMVLKAKEFSAAIVVDEPNGNAIQKALEKLRNPSFCRRVTQAAEILVCRELSPAVMSSRWEDGWNSD